MKRRMFVKSGIVLGGALGSAGCLGLFRGPITGNWAAGEWHDANDPYLADGLRADSGDRFYSTLVTEGPSKAVFVDSKAAQNFARTMHPTDSDGRTVDLSYDDESLLLLDVRMPADDAIDIVQTGGEWTGQESATLRFETRRMDLGSESERSDTSINSNEVVFTHAQPVNEALRTMSLEVTHRKYDERTLFEAE